MKTIIFITGFILSLNVSAQDISNEWMKNLKVVKININDSKDECKCQKNEAIKFNKSHKKEKIVKDEK